MKTINLYALALIALFCFTNCSGGEESLKPALSQPVTLAAEATNILVTLDILKEPVETAIAADNWLTVSVVPYTSGSPMLRLNATVNPNNAERKTKVIVTTTSKKKYDLIVQQKAKPAVTPEGTTIEDKHDSQTDQPAYSPKR